MDGYITKYAYFPMLYPKYINMIPYLILPSGKLLHNYGKPPFSMGENKNNRRFNNYIDTCDINGYESMNVI